MRSEGNMDALWRVELLGRLRALQDSRVLTRFRSQRVSALLAYLACYRAREELIELLWPERPPQIGRRNMRVEHSSLRQHPDDRRLTRASSTFEKYCGWRCRESGTADPRRFVNAVQAS
jgi:DNA-binding SARP family transcriptional activator